MRVTSSFHFVLLDFVILIIFDKEHVTLLLCCFIRSDISFFLIGQVLSSLANTLSDSHVTKLHFSRPRKDIITALLTERLSQQYVAYNFAALRIARCLLSPGLRCSCCNVIRFFMTLKHVKCCLLEIGS
jgi:hypothetical protein